MLRNEIDVLRKSVDIVDIEKMEKVGINQELMSMITELEMELSKLLPFKMSMSEKFYDFEKLKEVVQLLDEANKMIEE